MATRITRRMVLDEVEYINELLPKIKTDISFIETDYYGPYGGWLIYKTNKQGKKSNLFSKRKPTREILAYLEGITTIISNIPRI